MRSAQSCAWQTVYAYVSGLEHASYGEILLFEGGIRGMVQDLKEDRIGCILFGDYEAVRAGDAVRRTGKTAGIGAGDAYLGRWSTRSARR